MTEIPTRVEVYNGALRDSRLLYLCIYSTLVLLVYWSSSMSILSIWIRSETYAHGFLILPISIWLIWTKRSSLIEANSPPVLWVQLLLIPGGFVWLLSYIVDVLVIQQLALVGIIIVGAWSILGHQSTRVLAFPLGFLVLAVPMGEDLVPPMMEFTAISTVWLIKLSGIPVYREGLYFSLPTGNWSVVQACSGVRYLIASFTLGLLYAHLTYRSLARKTLFVFLSIFVPIIANTLRAYIIVMLGHFSDMTLATGVDHLIYGWVFFGVVMMILFWLGSFWREDQNNSIPVECTSRETRPSGAGIAPGIVLVSAIGMACCWPVFASLIDRFQPAYVESELAVPSADNEWLIQANKGWDWEPVDRGAEQKLVQFYSRGEDQVALYLQHYLRQEQGQELISGKSDQYVDDDTPWRIAGGRWASIQLGTGETTVRQLLLTQGDRSLVVWSWYRLGENYAAHPYKAKMWEALQAISFGRRDAAHIIIATTGSSFASADEILGAFLNARLTGIEQSLDHIVK